MSPRERRGDHLGKRPAAGMEALLHDRPGAVGIGGLQSAAPTWILGSSFLEGMGTVLLIHPSRNIRAAEDHPPNA